MNSLTTTALASYVLMALNASEATSALFITSSSDCKSYRASVESFKTHWYPTFGNQYDLPIPPISETSAQCQLIDSVFHGLRTLMRDHCIDYPKLDHVYFTQFGNASSESKILTIPSSSRSRASSSRRTPPKHAYLWSLHDDESIDRGVHSIAKKIVNSEFDVVIYADIYHKGENGVYLGV